MTALIVLGIIIIGMIVYMLTDYTPISKEERAYIDTVDKLLSARLPLTKALPEAEAYMHRKYGSKINWPYPAEEMLYWKKVGWLLQQEESENAADIEMDAMDAVKKTDWRHQTS